MPNLTQKLGPLPLWAWGGIAAIGVWFFLIRGKTGSSTVASTSAQANPNSTYGLGFAQGLQAAAPPSQTPIPAALQQVVAGSDNPGLQQYGKNIPLYTLRSQTVDGVTYGGTPVATVPFGTSLNVSGSPQSVPWGSTTATLIPVSYLGTSGQYYVSSSDIQYGNQAIGGPRRHASGSRSANLWHDSHPLIGAPVRYPHFVRAVGGPGNHHREVHRVARQAGVHPARVAMLNPVPTGMIRIA